MIVKEKIQTTLLSLVMISVFFTETISAFFILIFAASMMLSKGVGVRDFKIYKFQIGLSVFFLFAAMTLVYSADVQKGWGEIATFVLLIVFPWCIPKLAPKAIETGLKWFVIGNFLATLVCFCNAYLRFRVNGTWVEMNEYGMYYSVLSGHEFSRVIDLHASYFSVQLVLCIGVILYFYTNKTSNEISLMEKMGGIFFISYFIAVIGMLHSFAGIVALLACVFVWVVVSINSVNLKITFVCLLTLLGLNMLQQFNSKLDRRLDFSQFNIDLSTSAREGKWNNFNARWAKWQGAIQVIKSKPFFGVGVGGTEAEILEAYEDLGFQLGVERNYNEHSQFLRVWMQGGMIFFILYTMIIGFPILEGVKKSNVLLIFVGLIYFCFSVGESFMIRHKGVLVFAVFYSISFYLHIRRYITVENAEV